MERINAKDEVHTWASKEGRRNIWDYPSFQYPIILVKFYIIIEESGFDTILGTILGIKIKLFQRI